MFGDDAFPLWASKAGFRGEFFEHFDFDTCSIFLPFLDLKAFYHLYCVVSTQCLLYFGALLILFGYV